MILITGATGMVGSYLSMYLIENGHQIRAIYREETKIQNTKKVFEFYDKINLFDSIIWVYADLLDLSLLEAAFENVTTVYHCAALVSFDPKDEEKLRKTNIEGTANIVNFCIEKKILKLCYLSSIAAFGTKKDFEKYINEDSEWNPTLFHSDYALSKYGAEIEVWRGKHEGLNVVIVNPGVILSQPMGIQNWEDGSVKMFYLIKNGLKFYTNGTTGFVGVQDVVAILYKLMEASNFGKRYCIVSENCSFLEIGNEIAKINNVTPPNIQVKKWMFQFLIPLDWILGLITTRKRNFTSQISKSLFEESLYDNSKIKSEIDHKFIPIKKYLQHIKPY